MSTTPDLLPKFVVVRLDMWDYRFPTGHKFHSLAEAEAKAEELQRISDATIMDVTSCYIMTDPIALPPPAFRLIWRDGQYRVSAPNIGDTDCYTAELVRTHADARIRALTAEVSELKAEIARFIVSTVVLRDERDAALARAEKAEARAGSVPADRAAMVDEAKRRARDYITGFGLWSHFERAIDRLASAPSTPPDAQGDER